MGFFQIINDLFFASEDAKRNAANGWNYSGNDYELYYENLYDDAIIGDPDELREKHDNLFDDSMDDDF